MKINCPYCDNSLSVKRGSRVQNVYCKKCYSMFVIPPRPLVEMIAVTMMVSAMLSMLIATFTAAKSEIIQRSIWRKSGTGLMQRNEAGKMNLRYVPPVDSTKTDYKAYEFNEIDTIYTDAVKFGELKPGQVRGADIGKTVIWRGLLVEYGFTDGEEMLYAKFQHKPGEKSNVIVYLNLNHYQWLAQVRPGAYVTYSGVLNISGYGENEHVLVSGSIISVDQF